MLDFQQFVGKQIINSNGQTGVVISVTQERITIKFDNEEIYNPDIAFKRGAIKFVDETLNKLMLSIDSFSSFVPSNGLIPHSLSLKFFVVDRSWARP